MRDKVAQLLFEKIKISAIKEVNSLEDIDRGNKGFGSTGIKTTSEPVESETQSKSMSKIIMNETVQNASKFKEILMMSHPNTLKNDLIVQRQGK